VDPCRAAFTIVEMLVAVAVSVIVVVLLANVVSQALLTSRKANNELQAMNAAAAALDLIAGDIDSLSATRQPYEYFQAFNEPTAIDTASHAMRMVLLSTSAEDAGVSSTSSGIYTYPDSGLTHAICYQILYQDPLAGGSYALLGGSNAIFGLYRGVASSGTTFASVMGLSNEFTGFWKNIGGASLGPLMNNSQNGVTVDFIAPNVVDLEVAAYANTLTSSNGALIATGSTQLYNPPASAGHTYAGIQLTGTSPLENLIYTTSWTVSTAGVAVPASNKYYPLPNGASFGPIAYIEVSVTVIEDAAAKLWGNGKGTNKLAPAYLKNRYGHTLTRRILIHSPQ
jgi:type II secretory pathway pseudopilin PulG